MSRRKKASASGSPDVGDPSVVPYEDDGGDDLSGAVVARPPSREDGDGSAAAEFVDLAFARGGRLRTAPSAKLAPATSSSADENASELTRYFRDVAAHPGVPPHIELAIAKAFERAELDHWVTLLSYVPASELVLHALSIRLADSDEDEANAPQLPELMALASTTNRQHQGKLLAEDRPRWGRLAVGLAYAVRIPDAQRQWVAEARKVALECQAMGGTEWAFYRTAVNRTSDVRLKAGHRFVQSNLRLVVTIAQRYNRTRLPLIDLIQEGNIGLMKAIERFDYSRGYRFSTYASWWIRHAINRALADKGRAVRIPVHMLDTYNRVTRATQALVAKYGREPTDEELRKESKLDRDKLDKVKGFHAEATVSLDRPLGDDDGRRLVDQLSDEQAESALDQMAIRQWRAEVRELIEELEPLEQQIVRARFGFDGDEEATLREVGEAYGFSRERIRQLQDGAMAKLKERFAEAGVAAHPG